MTEETKKKMAIVVIHGIGEQKPFETIDSFVKKFTEEYRTKRSDFKLQHNLIWFENWGESCISLIPKNENYKQIDVLEYYWSHMTQRKITQSEVTDWLVKVARGGSKFPLYKERQIDSNRDDSALFNENGELRISEYLASILCISGWAKPFFKLAFGCKEAIPFLRNLKPIIDTMETIPILVYVKKIGDLLSQLFKALFSRAMVDYIGDIALYCTTDIKSEYFEVRKKILDAAVDKVKSLALNNDYDEILICGHSLGSVIAYDVIDRLEILMNKDTTMDKDKEDITPKQAEKFKGIVTFGSPLDKVAFFFDEYIDKTKQPIRHDIITHLHGARRRYYIDSNTRIRSNITRYLSDQNNNNQPIPWLNFWTPFDVISGHLDVYDPVKNLNLSDDKAIDAFLEEHKDLTQPQSASEENPSAVKKLPSQIKKLRSWHKMQMFIKSHNEYWESAKMHDCIISQFIPKK